MGRQLLTLAAPAGVHSPGYGLRFYRDGNPQAPVAGVDLRSVVAIQTSKSIQDTAGTWTITLKDRLARTRIREMDVARIRLRGHYSPGFWTVMRGVVDQVRKASSSDPYASQQDTIIEGRCIAKYAMINSLFLPVWDPEALLPTVLTYGLGDATQKVKPTPYAINRDLVRTYVFGVGDHVGVAGTPAAKHWLDYNSRWDRNVGLTIPFLQFNEDTYASAFKRLEVLGFTEAWIDELGRQVYRQPQWDQAIRYSIPTGGLKDFDHSRGDVDLATYVEVIPAGDPGIDSATAQALRAGRAPVPSSYLASDNNSLDQSVSAEFVIETDSAGKPTAKGRTNRWYRMQRRYGVRPQQISSPLIFDQQQAQAQAEGLLRFYSRMTKGVQATIPGCPELRLGYNARLHGPLEGGDSIDRVVYIEQISHDYVEGSHYLTSFTGTHGRDKGDPAWQNMVLPRFDPADLATGPGGVMDPNAGQAPAANVTEPNGQIGSGPAVDVNGYKATQAASKRLIYWTTNGSNVWICTWMVPQLLYALKHGWDGKINEGWRSIKTQEQYAGDGHHIIGSTVAPAGSSNHGLTEYPGGAIDVADPAGLARALRSYDPSADAKGRPAMIGNGAQLPADVVHFSASGR